jgi:hypothetical protein
VGAAADVDGVVHGQLRYIGETVATMDGKVTACNTGAVVISSGTITTVTTLTGITNTVGVKLVPQTTGGLSKARLISAASTNATSVKAAAGQLHGYALFNTTTSLVYVKFYDDAGTPDENDTPAFSIMLPKEGGANVSFGDSGVAFASGIAYRTVTGVADNDTGAVGAGAVLVNVWYK